MSKTSASVAHEEIAQFSSIAEDWWNPEGKFRPLHQLNPLRISYVRDSICDFKDIDSKGKLPLKGLKILDVGCGGGLMAEPLTRLGAKVTGVDASEATIDIARHHAEAMGLSIDYQVTDVERLAEHKVRYDVITALEIIEHVADVASFLSALSTLLKPDGLLIMSTLNRTTKSFLLGIVMAEYILRWVPAGTHSWKKFLRPSQLVKGLEVEGLMTLDISGVVYNPLRQEFQISPHDLDVNYMLSAARS